MPWAPNAEELDELAETPQKSGAGLMLADKPADEIPDVSAALPKSTVPARSVQLPDVSRSMPIRLPSNTTLTPTISPPVAPRISISIWSSEGIGAMLQIDDEYAKVSRLIPAGPADKQGELRPRI